MLFPEKVWGIFYDQTVKQHYDLKIKLRFWASPHLCCQQHNIHQQMEFNDHDDMESSYGLAVDIPETTPSPPEDILCKHSKLRKKKKVSAKTQPVEKYQVGWQCSAAGGIPRRDRFES